MPKPIESGSLFIRWKNGGEQIVGKFYIELGDAEIFRVKKKSDFTRRLGWAMVKQGILLMIKGERKEMGGKENAPE